MKIYGVILILLHLSISPSYAQKDQEMVYTHATTLGIHGKAATTKVPFHRIDTTAFKTIPKPVKNLLTLPAGLFIHFKSNTSTLSAKWCVSKKKLGNNMTAIMAKGLDVYIKNTSSGQWQFAGVGRPTQICNEAKLVSNMDNTEKEFLIYLPLFDTLSSLEIGVEQNATIEKLPNPFKHQVIIYGSSIVHGASASRPGMTYPARLSRATGINFVNMGVSGNAKMENTVADMLASFHPDAFILDCVPNSSPQQIKERTNYLVKKLREAHPKIPIIIMPTIIREHGYWDINTGDRVNKQNEQIKTEFERLSAEGIKGIYFINPPNLLGTDHEGTTDGTHPNDLGFDRMIKAIHPELSKILGKYLQMP